MSVESRAQFMRRVLFGLWAMATLILVFTVGLLAYEMADMGHNPLPPPEPSEAARAEPGPITGDRPTREVTLYFANEESTSLRGEPRALPLTSYTQENCRIAIEALVAGPQSGLTPVLPPTVEVRNVYLLEQGELVVDFSQELGTDPNRPRSASAEALMAYGIVQTVTQEGIAGDDGGSIERVRFLFEGSPLGDAFPDHLDLSLPLQPDSRWLATGGSASPR